MPSLKLGRERNIANQTYKIKNNLAPRYLKELITPIQNTKVHLPLFKSTRHGLNSFAYMALGFGTLYLNDTQCYLSAKRQVANKQVVRYTQKSAQM